MRSDRRVFKTGLSRLFFIAIVDQRSALAAYNFVIVANTSLKVAGTPLMIFTICLYNMPANHVGKIFHNY